VEHAADLGRRLLPAWREGPIPYELVNLATGEVGSREPVLGSSLAEAGTLQVEFEALTVATGDPRFRYRAEHAVDFLGSLLQEEGGLLPIMLVPTTPMKWTNPRVTLGGRGDSFYEYLLKRWLLTNRTEERYLQMYRRSVAAIRKSLVGRSQPSNLTFVREVGSLQDLRELLEDPHGNATWDAAQHSAKEVAGQIGFMLILGDPAAKAEEGSNAANETQEQQRQIAQTEEGSNAANETQAEVVPASCTEDTGQCNSIAFSPAVKETADITNKDTVDKAVTEASAVLNEETGIQEGEIQLEVEATETGEKNPSSETSTSKNKVFLNAISKFFQGNKAAFVALSPIPGEEICAVAEQLQAGRWDLSHNRLQITIPGDKASVPSQLVRENAAAVAAQHLANQCETWGFFKMDHLACFLPGLLALGVMTGAASNASEELRLAAELTEGCARMWHDSPIGLAPESSAFNVVAGRTNDVKAVAGASHSILRPETVESLWYLYMATGDSKYQDWGWRILEAIERHARVEGGGYSGIEDVLEVTEPRRRDRMETFLLSETFKYLFLLFAEGEPIFDLERTVLNTEGHPLPVTRPGFSC